MKDFIITKRDGSHDRFSLDKIMNAIIKAFQSVGEDVDLNAVSKILSHLSISEGITVEDIQNQVEEALMREGYYKVAKSFMLYRQRHNEDRETLEKLKFLTDYCKASNAATGSKFDANANVEHKTSLLLSENCPRQASSASTAACSSTASSRCSERTWQKSISTSSTITLYIRTTRHRLPTTAHP